MDVAGIAEKVFGISELRPAQREAAETLVTGRDGLVVMPSGGGKSVICQAAVEAAERHRSIERSRVEMMRRYADLTDRRHRPLLRYFGEFTQEPCGRCDNCEAGWSIPADEEDAAYAPGERVRHRDWGRGTLLGYKDGRLTVVFDRVAYKELLEDAVTGEDLLRQVRG